MSKLTAAMFLSLDGVMEEPSWTMPFWNDEIARFKEDELRDIDALLLGRVTYEGFAAVWPDSRDEGAERMNNMPKFVATRTLHQATWNATFLRGDAEDEVFGLKERGQNLLMYGSGQLVRALLSRQLIDELRLLVYPLVLGKGQRLFDESSKAELQLVRSEAFSSGVVALVYKLARA